jgi:peptidoglycan/LPS O-acetylase OafA/YrhL
VLAATVLSFLLASIGAFHYYIETVMISGNNNYDSYWTFTPDIVDAIKQAAWGSFFTGSDTYNPVLWTMTVEFYGSMLVFVLALLFGVQRNRWTFYLAAAVFFFNSYYFAFIIGMGLADIFNNKASVFKTDNKMILSVILFSGLFLGSYPVGTVTSDSLYGFLNNGFFEIPKLTYHILGAVMIMYVLLNSQWLQKVFSSPVPVFLGKISYSLYLIHFLIISSFTCALFLALHQILPYWIAVFVSCFLSVLLIIPLSYLFYKYIDMVGVGLSKVFYNRAVDPIISSNSWNIKQKYLSSTIFGIYNKIFK